MKTITNFLAQWVGWLAIGGGLLWILYAILALLQPLGSATPFAGDAGVTLITNPLTFPPVYFAAYRLGLWVTGETAGAVPERRTAQDRDDELSLWQKITGIGRPLFVGLAITATIAGLASYVTISLAWHWIDRYRRRREK